MNRSCEQAVWYECGKCAAGISSKRTGLQRCITGGYCDPRPVAAPIAPAEAGECANPPEGWMCTRGAGHDGPCAAWPTNQPSDDHVAWLRFKQRPSGVTSIHVCNPDDAGAFKVYRAKPSAEEDGWIAFVCSLLPELDAAERLAQKVDRVHSLKLAFAIRKVSNRIIERAEVKQ